ncbi:MAG TPA: hypothetical protein VFA98_00580 [Thermoanaerobaculia bacterium]|nr:hypothetical protein [Thermoanaerobaculia bacterium]
MRMRRVAVGLLALVLLLPLALYAAYFPLTRWLLSGPKLRAIINAHPESFRIDWDEAVSPRPGHVRLRNLRLRGSDPNVQWAIDLEEAELDYSLVALLHRTFQCTRLVGSGLSFALRSKIEPGKVETADVRLLPPIPGFSDPPLKKEGEVFRLEPNPFHIDVRGVSIDRAESLWVNQLHYRGAARVSGGFYLWPTRLARIDDAVLQWDGGALTVGKSPDRVAFSGKLATSSNAFEPINAPMPRALREFRLKLDLDLSTEGLRAVEEYVRFPEGVRLEGKGPKATVSLASEQGVANGKVTLAVRGGAARTRTYRLTGDLDASVPIRRWDLTGPVSFDASGVRVALAHVHASGADEAREWWGTFEAPRAKIGPVASGRIEAHCRDARPLLALLNVNLPGWTKGLLKLDDLRAAAAVSAAPGEIRVRDLEATGDKFRVQGQYAHDGKTNDGAFLFEQGILIVGVEVGPTGTKLRPLFAKQWYAKAMKEGAGKAT